MATETTNTNIELSFERPTGEPPELIHRFRSLWFKTLKAEARMRHDSPWWQHWKPTQERYFRLPARRSIGGSEDGAPGRCNGRNCTSLGLDDVHRLLCLLTHPSRILVLQMCGLPPKIVWDDEQPHFVGWHSSLVTKERRRSHLYGIVHSKNKNRL
jgi:hypothetical protein